MQLRVTCSFDLEDGGFFKLSVGSYGSFTVSNIPEEFFSLRENMLLDVRMYRHIDSVSCIMQPVPDITGKSFKHVSAFE